MLHMIINTVVVVKINQKSNKLNNKCVSKIQTCHMGLPLVAGLV